ncbi:MAG: CHAD domain-containing protein [Chloroflexi bacterium]|nr:CHAD domain-containing protein [Chloroflexota bacterium]
MLYRLHQKEPLAIGIRRIALARIDKALRQLTDPTFNRDKAVHDARKTCKRLRAILRLIRDEVGYDYYREQNICFRDASRQLAPARDSAVLVDTLDGVLIWHDEKLTAVPLPSTSKDETIPPAIPLRFIKFTPLREKLITRHHELTQQVLTSNAVPNYISAVRQARIHVASWPIKRDGLEALAGGIRRVYTRGHLRMQDAATNTTAETLHEWRKRVKYLWCQLEILTPIWPDLLEEQAESLHTLSSLLGDDHDCAELRHLIENNPNLLPDEEERAELFALIEQRRLAYQEDAWPLGKQLYLDEPQVFVNNLTTKWQDWRDKLPVITVEDDEKRPYSLPSSLQITTREAANHLKLTTPKIRKLIQLGKLPAFKLGRQWIITANLSTDTNLLSTLQVAAMLQTNVRHVRRLIRKGQLPAIKFGNYWAIKESDVWAIT